MTHVINKITKLWIGAGIIEEADEDIYEYGLDLIIYSILNIVAIVLTAVIMNKLPESIILVAAVIPLQSCGGGYHAKTHLRCFLIMYIGWWCVMFVLPFVTPTAATIGACTSIPIIFMVAPVSHENVIMSAARRLVMRRRVRIFSASMLILSISMIWAMPFLSWCGILLSVALIIIAVSMVAACVRNAIRKQSLSN